MNGGVPSFGQEKFVLVIPLYKVFFSRPGPQREAREQAREGRQKLVHFVDVCMMWLDIYTLPQVCR